MLTPVRRCLTAVRAAQALRPHLRPAGYTIRAGRVGDYPAVLTDGTVDPLAAVADEEGWTLAYVHPADARDDWSEFGPLAPAGAPLDQVAAAIRREAAENF